MMAHTLPDWQVILFLAILSAYSYFHGYREGKKRGWSDGWDEAWEVYQKANSLFTWKGKPIL